MDCNSPDSSVHGISQARILEWVAMPSSKGYSCPRDQTHISCIGRQILYHWVTWEASSTTATAAATKSLQSCLTLCDPIDGIPPGFPDPGILQARTLEWVAISLPLIQAQVMQERVPASAVRHEKLTVEHPWPLSASQQSRELGSTVSSNSPQRFLLRGACWICKDTKMEVPEGRVSSKVPGCQRNEYIKWLWKKWWKRSTL